MENEMDPSRRRFFVRLTLGLTALSAAAAGIPVLSALFAPLLQKAPALWRRVAAVDDLAIGAMQLVSFENSDPRAWAGESARTAAWLRRDTGDKFTAFSA